MKFPLPRIGFLVSFLAGGALLCGAENAGADKKNGYTVVFEIKVNDKGEEESLKIVESNDTTSDKFIDRMAMAFAIATDLPPREKDGAPIAYTARVPFFIPVEGDEGADANNAPRPTGTGQMTVPLYPVAMREQGIVGGAIFELQVDATGKLAKLTTLRASHPEFEAAARETLQGWQFRPAEKDGQPVASRWNIAVVFEMDGKFVDLKYRVPPRPSLGMLKIVPNAARGEEAGGDGAGAAPLDTPAAPNESNAPAGQAKE